MIAARSQAAFGALVDGGETPILAIATKLEREISDRSLVDADAGWTDMRQILSRMAVVHASLLADE